MYAKLFHFTQLLILALLAAGCAYQLPDDIYQPTTPVLLPEGDNDEAYVPAQLPEQRYTTAVLLPLSGAQHLVAKDMADAVLLAIRLLDQEEKLDIVTFDTAGNPQGTVAAMERALLHKPDIVLGPLFGANAKALYPYAAELPIISFSNDHSLGQYGVFSFGFLPAEQVQFVLNHAIEGGKNRFSALLPDTEYGRMLGKIFEDSLARTSSIKGHVGYYAQFDQTLLEHMQAIAALPQSAEINDALFIPAEHEYLVAILRRFNRIGDISQFQLLGMGNWDTPRTLMLPELQGAWFASSHPKERTHFEQIFHNIHGRTPNRIASLGYDAGALAYMLSTGITGAPYSAAAITNPRGFDGINGVFRMQPEGYTVRELTVLEVKEGKAIEAVHAPESDASSQHSAPSAPDTVSDTQ